MVRGIGGGGDGQGHKGKGNATANSSSFPTVGVAQHNGVFLFSSSFLSTDKDRRGERRCMAPFPPLLKRKEKGGTCAYIRTRHIENPSGARHNCTHRHSDAHMGTQERFKQTHTHREGRRGLGFTHTGLLPHAL